MMQGFTRRDLVVMSRIASVMLVASAITGDHPLLAIPRGIILTLFAWALWFSLQLIVSTDRKPKSIIRCMCLAPITAVLAAGIFLALRPRERPDPDYASYTPAEVSDATQRLPMIRDRLLLDARTKREQDEYRSESIPQSSDRSLIRNRISPTRDSIFLADSRSLNTSSTVSQDRELKERIDGLKITTAPRSRHAASSLFKAAIDRIRRVEYSDSSDEEVEGAFKYAAERLENAIRAAPSYLPAKVALACVRSHAENGHEEAVRLLTEVIEADPSHADAWFHRADVFWDDDEAELALFDINQSIQLRPKFAHAYRLRAKILADTDIIQSTIDELEFERLGGSSSDAYMYPWTIQVEHFK